MDSLDGLLAALAAGDDQAAEAAVAILASSPIPPFAALAALYTHPDSERRWWAIRALSALAPPQGIPVLLNAIHDLDESVRLCAVLGLRENPHPSAVDPLIALLSDPDRLLARLAGDALIAIGSPATGPLLEAVISAGQPARLEACRALAGIGDPEAITILFKLLDDDSALLEYWASEGLERMGIGMSFFNPG